MNPETSEWEWEAATFDNNPYGIVFGYTRRIDQQEAQIAGAEMANLFDKNDVYPSNQGSPLRNIPGSSHYDGTPADQASFFIDGVVDTKALGTFIQASTPEFKGIKFIGNGVHSPLPNNPNQYVMVISGQNQINGKFDTLDPILAEEALVWYIKNTTKAAMSKDVNIFAFNELVRTDNYWIKAMKKTPEQIIELAMQTVRQVAKDKTNIKFMLNDGASDSDGVQLSSILQIISDLEKREVLKSGELVIGMQYHNKDNYNINYLNKAIEKLHAAGIKDIRLTEVDIMGHQRPSDEQILKYYKDLIKAVKEQKKLYQDLNISVVFFDEKWGTDYLGENSRITDVSNGLYQLIAELYK